MDAQQTENVVEPMQYSPETLSCFCHVECPQVSLYDSSLESFKDNMTQNIKNRFEKIQLTKEQVEQSNKILIVVGPSGVGKSTLIKMLMDKHPGKFQFSISHTTRQPREGEQHAVNYFFVSHEQFQAEVDADGFVEYCHVHGNMYGTSKAQIADMQSKGLIPILDIDIQGTEKFLKVYPESNTLFMLPPSIEELQTRLVNRGTETEEKIKLRITNASKEIAQALVKDDPKALIGYRLINKELDKASKLFIQMIELMYEQELEIKGE